ncbi:MAG: GTPase Era [Gammaproteobacteria bacterium]
MQNTKCGYIAILGRPNVGKSTLLNAILGQKVSIISRKPQTTRHRILGIKTEGNAQMIYVDTPGLYQARKRAEKCALNRAMQKTALGALSDVDLIIFVAEALVWREDDEWILQKINVGNGHARSTIHARSTTPVILVVSKVDLVKDKEELLPYLTKLKEKMDFVAIVPISAEKGVGVESLSGEVAKLLPENPFFFPEDQITDRSDRFFASEIVREKLMRFLGDELPYAIDVHIENFKDEEKIVRISALILVEKTSQKAIVIGKGGAKLKEIGTAARKELEKSLGKKVFLELWVKVKENWSDDQKILQEFGYES